MSSSIAIPTRAKQRKGKQKADDSMAASMASHSRYGSSSDSRYGSFGSSADSPQAGPGSGSGVMAHLSRESPTLVRRPSLMSETFTRTEHTTVQVGDPENPRLITCVKASQGFDWNQEMFLPPYLSHDGEDLERKQDPIEDIIVTDEEIANLLPS